MKFIARIYNFQHKTHNFSIILFKKKKKNVNNKKFFLMFNWNIIKARKKKTIFADLICMISIMKDIFAGLWLKAWKEVQIINYHFSNLRTRNSIGLVVGTSATVHNE